MRLIDVFIIVVGLFILICGQKMLLLLLFSLWFMLSYSSSLLLLLLWIYLLLLILLFLVGFNMNKGPYTYYVITLGGAGVQPHLMKMIMTSAGAVCKPKDLEST